MIIFYNPVRLFVRRIENERAAVKKSQCIEFEAYIWKKSVAAAIRLSDDVRLLSFCC